MGGLVAAQLTLGVSLIISAVGGGVCAVGGATVAGAGITEYFISKKKVAGIQEVIEENNKLAKEIQVLWESIFFLNVMPQERSIQVRTIQLKRCFKPSWYAAQKLSLESGLLKDAGAFAKPMKRKSVE